MLLTDEGDPDPATTETLPVLKEKKETRPPQDSEMKMPEPSLMRAKLEGPQSVTLNERPSTDPGWMKFPVGRVRLTEPGPTIVETIPVERESILTRLLPLSAINRMRLGRRRRPSGELKRATELLPSA